MRYLYIFLKVIYLLFILLLCASLPNSHTSENTDCTPQNARCKIRCRNKPANKVSFIVFRFRIPLNYALFVLPTQFSEKKSKTTFNNC